MERQTVDPAERSPRPRKARGAGPKALQRALRQKTALLHEVDHRVKNNLQLIASLILLQSRRTADPAAREALNGTLERVNAIATVHRRLFRSEDVERFDLAAFVRDLAGHLQAASARPEIDLRLELERVEVAADRAAPAALVLNELIGNAVKHGFPGGAGGTVAVRLRQAAKAAQITVADDGVGFARPEADSRGFGLTIAHLMCRQLGAELVFQRTQPGVCALVTLPTNLGNSL
jgi:two-component sensor histidine kinase